MPATKRRASVELNRNVHDEPSTVIVRMGNMRWYIRPGTPDMDENRVIVAIEQMFQSPVPLLSHRRDDQLIIDLVTSNIDMLRLDGETIDVQFGRPEYMLQ